MAVPPGGHHLTVRVDNRMILPYRPDAHSVSDSLANAWNGLVGKMELRATPTVWIDDAQIFLDAAKKVARISIAIGNASGHSGQGTLSVVSGHFKPSAMMKPLGFPLAWETKGGKTSLTFAVGKETPLWDEFHPALQTVTLVLAIDSKNADDPVYTTREITFGLRDFHAERNQFILNGQPVFFRGTHFGGDFPLTGFPPTDVASWQKIIQTCKEYGLNHLRFHSWCPPEAAFAAADELGFYLQVECGMWNQFAPGGEIEKMLYAETARIIKAYGNHPSFLLLSASNEAGGRWKQVLPDWVKHFRTADPRRLYTPDTGWSLIDSPIEPLKGGADYLAIGRIGPKHVRGEHGWFGGDYQDAIAGVNVPVISHEVGQWAAYPDFDVIKKFTGFVQPGNYDIFRDSAAAHGVLAQNKNFAQASGAFQLACDKEEIEAALRTPGLGGFQLLDLHDYTGQGTALVGVLDPFWESKGYATPDAFTKFCGPVVPLARLKQRLFTTMDRLNASVEVANFSAAPLTNAQMVWSIRDVSGKVLMQNAAAPLAVPIGKNIPVGTISAALADLPAPAQYQLVVTLGPQPIDSLDTPPPVHENTWNFWVYPKQIDAAIPAGITVTRSFDDAEKTLAAGGKVLFVPNLADLDWSSPPLARVPVFWNALMGPTWSRMLGLWCDTNSPALAHFPTASFCDWQWTDLVRNARAINLDQLPPDLTPIVSAIDDWNRNHKLGVLVEASVGPGKLLLCALNLDARPGAQQLRRSLLDYMASAAFQPKTKLSATELRSLQFDNRVMHKLGAIATADGSAANELLDGDPYTFWSSADARDHGPKPPHEISISFPQAVAMSGLVVMPRQNHREHQGDIREFVVQASEDGTNWQKVATGQLASTFAEQRIGFAKTITAERLKLTALSGFGNDTSAALAELAIIYAGPKLAENTGSEIEYQRVRTASPDIDAGEIPSRPANKR